MKRVVVASTNPVKINTTRRAFERMFPDEEFEVFGVSASSDVSDQPMGEKEILLGATNRVKNARKVEVDADYWVGIEGGLEDFDNNLLSYAWIVVESKEGVVGKGRTSSFFQPYKVAELVKRGKELGDADDIVFGLTNSKQGNGSVGILTGDVLTRTTYYEPAVILALIPFALNSAVDKLLKQEFDIHRVKGTQHPLLEKYGVDARPVQHEKLDEWRQNFIGVQFLHKPSNLMVFGAIDDLWINSKDEYVVVDYKSTSKAEEITELNKEWQDGYKRQMEVYQWLLRGNGYKVSDTGYFVYCNGITDREAFDARLEFEVTLIPYKGSDEWIEGMLAEIKECLLSDRIPEPGKDCDYCVYRRAVIEVGE